MYSLQARQALRLANNDINEAFDYLIGSKAGVQFDDDFPLDPFVFPSSSNMVISHKSYKFCLLKF